MHIYIPTRGRSDKLATGTLSLLPHSLLADTTLVVHSDNQEPRLYREALEKIGLPGLNVLDFKYENIAEKRLCIGNDASSMGYEKFVMLDDDIDFLIRKAPDNWQLHAPNGVELELMFKAIESELNRYSMVGISPREGNNRFGLGGPSDLVFEKTRLMRVLAFRTEDFLSVEHCRVPVMEDFDITLQLLRQGKKNIMLAYYANGQKATNAPGGCSLWRTLELHNAAAHKLAELHPRYVKTRHKKNKSDNAGLEERTEVTIQWKKAYKESQQ